MIGRTLQSVVALTQQRCHFTKLLLSTPAYRIQFTLFKELSFMSVGKQVIPRTAVPNRITLNPVTWLGQLSESRYWAYFLILPSLIFIIAIVIYPVANGIGLSFQELRLNRPDRTGYVGLEHYIDLFSDRVFLKALSNTVIWVVGGITSQFLLGLVTALALNRPLRGLRIARVLVLLPWILPSVVAAHMWALMLDSRLGVINDLLLRLGLITQYRAWFAEKDI